MANSELARRIRLGEDSSLGLKRVNVGGGCDYRLWVADPVYERRYLAKLDGDYVVDDCFLTVSLGEPYQGACYKLVAAVMAYE